LALSFLMLAPVFIWFAPEMTRKELTGFIGAAFSARRARSAGEWRHSFAWRGSWTTRLSAFRLPLFIEHETAEALETEAGRLFRFDALRSVFSNGVA
jgi:hypothetical protein